jgi:hypothetical protein
MKREVEGSASRQFCHLDEAGQLFAAAVDERSDARRPELKRPGRGLIRESEAVPPHRCFWGVCGPFGVKL